MKTAEEIQDQFKAETGVFHASKHGNLIYPDWLEEKLLATQAKGGEPQDAGSLKTGGYCPACLKSSANCSCGIDKPQPTKPQDEVGDMEDNLYSEIERIAELPRFAHDSELVRGAMELLADYTTRITPIKPVVTEEEIQKMAHEYAKETPVDYEASYADFKEGAKAILTKLNHQS